MRPEDFRQFCIALIAAMVGFCAVFLWVWAMAAAYEFLFGAYGYEVAFWGTFLLQRANLDLNHCLVFQSLMRIDR